MTSPVGVRKKHSSLILENNITSANTGDNSILSKKIALALEGMQETMIGGVDAVTPSN